MVTCSHKLPAPVQTAEARSRNVTGDTTTKVGCLGASYSSKRVIGPCVLVGFHGLFRTIWRHHSGNSKQQMTT